MRKIVLTASLLAVLAAAAIGWAAWNLNRYLHAHRAEIAAHISEALGRPVRFSSLGVSWHRGIAIAVEDLHVPDDAAFQERGDLLAIPSLLVVVRLVPALRGRLELARIELVQPRLTVVRTRAGLNTNALGKARREQEEPGHRRAQLPGLGAIAVRDGTLVLIDRGDASAGRLRVDHLQLEARGTRAGWPVRFKLSGALASAQPNLVASGELRLEEEGEPATLTAHLSVARLDLERALDLARPWLAQLPLSGNGEIALRADVAASGTTAEFRVGLRADEANVSWSRFFQKKSGQRLRIAAHVEARPGEVEIDEGSLAAGSIEGKWRGHVPRKPPSDARPRFLLELPAADLAELAKLVPPLQKLQPSGAVRGKVEFVLREHAPADLNGNLRLASVDLVAPSGIRISAQAATVRLSGRQIELSETQAHLAGRPVRLEATIGDYATKTLEFTVRAPEIDSRDLGLSPADRRPPVALTDLETVGIVHLARNDDPIWIRAHLSAGSGTVASVPVKAVRAVIRLEEERLVFSPLALELLDGSLVVEGAYHRSPGGQPGFNLKGHASGIDLEKFAEAIGATKRLDGRLSGEVTLAGPAVEWSKMRDKLVGGGSVTIRDGTLHGVNIVSSVLRGIGKLPGLSLVLSAPVLNKYPALIPGGKTVFRELRSRFTVAEGAILSDEIVVAGSDFNIAGRGTVGLDGSTDVRAVFEASVPLTSDLVDAVAPLRLLVGGTQRISVPFRLRGRAPKLSVKLDPAYLGKHLGRGIVDLVTGRRLIDALTGAASPGGGAAPASPEGARPADSRPVPPGRPVLPGSATTTQERGQTEPAPAREPAAPAGPGQAEPTPDR